MDHRGQTLPDAAEDPIGQLTTLALAPADTVSDEDCTRAARAVHRDWYDTLARHGNRLRPPSHLQMLWTETLWTPIASAAGAPPSNADLAALQEVLSEHQRTARTLAWTKQGLVPSRGDECGPRSSESWSGHELGTDSRQPCTELEHMSARQVWERLSACSAVLGMHPDGATEAIVDFALACDKPFAVVPCCVYSSQFPKRRDANNRQVTSYSQLVKFLVDKAPDRICVAALPFEGKNLVVYSKPTASRAPMRPDSNQASSAPICQLCEAHSIQEYAADGGESQ